MNYKTKLLLLEATRRWLMFHKENLNETLTSAWTGLGYRTEYEPAILAGLMDYASYDTKPRIDLWFHLTESGAKIVQRWLDNGVTVKDFDSWDYVGGPEKLKLE